MTAKELEEFMERHEMTAPDIADVLGVTLGAIHHWLVGRRAISLTVSRCLKLFDKHPQLIKEFRG